MPDPEPVTRLQPIVLEGPAGPLEALLQEREGEEPAVTALVCHPHPLYGGTLHNKVVHRVAATLHAGGAAVLRFNFRGAGRSAGHFDGGDGEVEDARAALAFLRARHPGARRWVAGFSFGSWIAARFALTEREVERLILIAPPVVRSNFDMLRSRSIPKLVIQGTADEVCPIAALEAAYSNWAEPKELIRVVGASHFFDRQLGALAEALVQGLPELAKGATS